MPTATSKDAQKNSAPKRKHGTSVISALEQVRELIVTGKLSPGTWIFEGELAKRLNISRTPARAVLQWLQQEGYVREHRTAAKSSMIVSPLTKEDAKELYAVIGHLEGLAGRATAALPKPERMAIVTQLKEFNQKLTDARNDPSKLSDVFDLDNEFHALVVTSGAGPRLRAWHKAIEPQVERYWRLYASSIMSDLEHSIREHADIIQALTQGDAERTERCLQINWENGYDRLEHVINIFGERGSW